MRKHALIVMDSTGDSRHEFDPSNSVEVKAAMDEFHRLTGSGYFAASRGSQGGEATITRSFDPTQSETLLYPRYIGG